MVEKRLGRNLEYALLHILEVADCHYRVQVRRVADNKVAETEIVHDSLSEVYRQLLAVLIDEDAAERRHGIGVRCLR